MKKIFFSLIALCMSMNINAQHMKIMKGDEVVAIYPANKADKVVFEEGKLTPINFSVSKESQTRATSNNQSAIHSQGFGVFAYEHGTQPFAVYVRSNSYPNLMYNQKVTYESSKWTYTPEKYYSNAEGAMHSFFAYAPYNASVQSVIRLGGAPGIIYNNDDNIDLLYATYHTDLLNPNEEKAIEFAFKHALSQINVHVASMNSSENTEVTLKSLKLVGQLSKQGFLRLDNGSWESSSYNESLELCDQNFLIPFQSGIPAYTTVKENGMIIPGKFKIQVEYDVTTPDRLNPSASSTMINTMTSQEFFELTQGKAYDFYIDLGLTSVKFTTSVSDWPVE